MNLSIDILRFDIGKFACLMVLFAIVVTINCQPMEEAIVEEAVSNSEFDSSFFNDQQPHIQSKNGGISCYAGRAGCISSCQWQNCGTGYCRGGWGGTCVCSRCDNGN